MALKTRMITSFAINTSPAAKNIACRAKGKQVA